MRFYTKIVFFVGLFVNNLHSMHEGPLTLFNYYDKVSIIYNATFKELDMLSDKKDSDDKDPDDESYTERTSECLFHPNNDAQLYIIQKTKRIMPGTTFNIFKCRWEKIDHVYEAIGKFLFKQNTVSQIGWNTIVGIRLSYNQERDFSSKAVRSLCAACLKQEKDIEVDPDYIAIHKNYTQAACVTLDGQIFFFNILAMLCRVAAIKNKLSDVEFFYKEKVA